MPDIDVCPLCGNPISNGVCLDCGTVATKKQRTANERYEDRFDMETQSLDDVAPPSLFSISGDEEITAEKAMEIAEKANQPAERDEPVNPYANMIPYERPDYGDNYAAPRTIINTDGVPQALKNEDRGDLLPSQQVKLSRDKTWLSYWWLILILFFLPYQISYFQYLALAIGAGLLKFDEKGGRQAGVIIIVIAALKLLLLTMTSY